MIPIAPSEVAARVNFAFVDIVRVGSGDGEATATETCQVCGKVQVSVAYRKAALGPHDLAVTINIQPVANNHRTSGAVVT